MRPPAQERAWHLGGLLHAPVLEAGIPGHVVAEEAQVVLQPVNHRGAGPVPRAPPEVPRKTRAKPTGGSRNAMRWSG